MPTSPTERTHAYATRHVRRAHLWLERMMGERTKVEVNRQRRVDQRRAMENPYEYRDATDRLEETT